MSKRSEADDTIAIMVVAGVEGPSLYVDDTRVAGPKPWGGGRPLYTFSVSKERLRELVGGAGAA